MPPTFNSNCVLVGPISLLVLKMKMSLRCGIYNAFSWCTMIVQSTNTWPKYASVQPGIYFSLEFLWENKLFAFMCQRWWNINLGLLGDFGAFLILRLDGKYIYTLSHLAVSHKYVLILWFLATGFKHAWYLISCLFSYSSKKISLYINIYLYIYIPVLFLSFVAGRYTANKSFSKWSKSIETQQNHWMSLLINSSPLHSSMRNPCKLINHKLLQRAGFHI